MGMMIANFNSSGIPSNKHLLMLVVIGVDNTLEHSFTNFEGMESSLQFFDYDYFL